MGFVLVTWTSSQQEGIFRLPFILYIYLGGPATLLVWSHVCKILHWHSFEGSDLPAPFCLYLPPPERQICTMGQTLIKFLLELLLINYCNFQTAFVFSERNYPKSLCFGNKMVRYTVYNGRTLLIKASTICTKWLSIFWRITGQSCKIGTMHFLKVEIEVLALDVFL